MCCCDDDENKDGSGDGNHYEGQSQKQIDELGRAGMLASLRARVNNKKLGTEERAAAKRELDREAIVLYGRKTTFVQRFESFLR